MISEEGRKRLREAQLKGAITQRKIWEEKTKEYYENPKRCLYCNKPIIFKFRKKCNFCSSSCSASYNNRKKIKKYCIVCGNKCKKNADIYCSHKCRVFYEKMEKINKWISGEWCGAENSGNLSSAIRNYLFEKYNNSCQKCGWNEINPLTKKVPLTIHHIDGNFKNNMESNLEVLCPNCHSLTPTYGGLNRGNGRGYRYKNKEHEDIT